MASPYDNQPEANWLTITRDLIDSHPLDQDELVDVVLACWNDILSTKIAGRLQIGTDAPLSPQMMGNFLHALIPVELEERHPGIWRKDRSAVEKDLVFIADSQFSTEIKTSSSASNIFANRSYAQPSLPGTKNKDGFYIGVNFQKFDVGPRPAITRVAFGWLDHSDWIPQASATGQQAFLRPAAKMSKLIALYRK